MNIKELFLNFKNSDFFNNVNLHIHSNYSDGKMHPETIIKQAKERGKKYIAISDHNTVGAYLSTDILKENFLIPSVEFDCFYKGVLIHILGYSMDINNIELKKLFAKSKLGTTNNLYRILKLRKAKDVIKIIKQANGLSVLAHPACYWCINLDSFVKSLIDLGLDGIETYYPYNGFRGILKFHSKKSVKKIADKYNLLKTGGSDSHGKNLL